MTSPCVEEIDGGISVGGIHINGLLSSCWNDMFDGFTILNSPTISVQAVYLLVAE